MKTEKPITILMVDDDEDDRLMAHDAFRAAQLRNDTRFVENGKELLDYLRRRNRFSDPAESPTPGLILLDLNMPLMDGREALREINADPSLRKIPVVVFTSSQSGEEIIQTYELGVNSFITKPATFDGLVRVMTTIRQYWFEIVELPINHEPLSG